MNDGFILKYGIPPTCRIECHFSFSAQRVASKHALRDRVGLDTPEVIFDIVKGNSDFAPPAPGVSQCHFIIFGIYLQQVVSVPYNPCELPENELSLVNSTTPKKPPMQNKQNAVFSPVNFISPSPL